MAYIDWDNSYSVGIIEFDAQHKKLVDIINELHDAMKVGKGSAVIGTILKEMVKYTVTHFSYEEKILDLHNYPRLAGQKAEHAYYVEKINSFVKEYESGISMMSIDVSQFLKDWLMKHIMGTDRDYSEFLNSKGVK
jgi:hemerythrin